MWKYIKLLYKRVPDPIRTLTPISLPHSLHQAFGSKIYYTPKLQKLAFTEELAKYIRFVNRKDKITDADLRSLTEAILIEYGNIHGLQSYPKFKDQINYGITKKFMFKQNELSPFYGEVDYMIWLNSTHFVPVLFLEKELNQVAGLAMAHATMALKSIARSTTITSGYSIVTTGQQWQMFKVYNNLNAEKTVVYQGRNRFRNIVEDYEMIQTIFGLIDQSLQTEREEVNILKLAYDVIDERRFMLEADTTEEAEKISPASKVFLTFEKKIKQFTSK